MSPTFLILILGLVSGALGAIRAIHHETEGGVFLGSPTQYMQPHLAKSKQEEPLPKHNSGDGTIEGVKVIKSKGRKMTESSSSSESSSNEADYWQPKPHLTMPPNAPLLPFFVAYKGNSFGSNSNVDSITAVTKFAEQIGKEMANPNVITGMKTLSKFNILVQVVRTMTAEQLKITSEKLFQPFSEIPQTSKSGAASFNTWVAFRDAVAQAGTGPALVTISEWIATNMANGEEAAELISVLPNTARYPTEEYMDAFYNLVTSDEVSNELFLNTSSILSFTNLVRKVLVSNMTAHNRFPVHSFGHFIRKDNKDITEKYLNYLSQELKKSVQDKNNVTIQVYIRALGNTAHPKIVSIFEPYLEGDAKVSGFQRLLIIASFDKIVRVHPKLTRSVLFNVYQNTGELSEIRAAAVIQLMKTNPPVEILQRMAEFTHFDQSRQVKSVVKSAIESAARLTSPSMQELAQKAKSAANLLTTEEFGLQYSSHFLQSHFINEDIGYMADLSWIQSKDSIFPSSMFYNHKRNLGSLKRQNFQMAVMTSSSEDFVNFILDHFTEYPQKRTERQKPDQSQKVNSKWSWNDITRMLKIQTETSDELEGNFLFTTLGGRRFLPFDANAIKTLQNYIKNSSYSLRSGKAFNFTKIYNQHEMNIGFPTATGLPFMFSFSIPTLASIGGEVSGKAHPDISLGDKNEFLVPVTVNASADVNLIYSSKTQGKIEFVTPFNHHGYSTILEKNVHVHLTFAAGVDFDRKNQIMKMKFNPLVNNEKNKLFEYSTEAYTTKYDIFDLVPSSATNSSQSINPVNNTKFEKRFGEKSTGYAFKLQAETAHPFGLPNWVDMAQSIQKHGVISSLLYPAFEESINNNNYTLVFDAEKSKTSHTDLEFAYYDVKDQSDEDSKGSTHDSRQKKDLKTYNLIFPFSRHQRQEQCIKKTKYGIKESQTKLLDVSVVFNQPESQNTTYIASIAHAFSDVSEVSRFIFWLDKYSTSSKKDLKPLQLSLQVDTKTPKIPIENYHKALKEDPTSSINSWLTYGEDSNSATRIVLEGKMRRSKNRLDFLRSHAVAKLCDKQMKDDNFNSPACRNVTANAAFLDQYKFTVDYENLADCCKSMAYQAYSVARQLLYTNNQENLINPKESHDKLSIGFHFSTNLKYLNVSIRAPEISSEFSNLHLSQMAIPLLVMHPKYTAIDRIGQKILQGQQYPVCAVDGSEITTFDSKIYPLKINKCWHVLMHSSPKSKNYVNFNTTKFINTQLEQIAITARTVNDSSKEVILLLGQNVIELQPDSGNGSLTGKVKVNGQNANLSSSSTVKYSDSFGAVYLETYALSTGAVKIKASQAGLEMIYDGRHIKIQVSNHFRNQLRGLCGNFDGEDFSDFLTPKKCIAKSVMGFAFNYILEKEKCQFDNANFSHINFDSCVEEKVLIGDVITISNEATTEKPKSNKTRTTKSTGLASQNLDSCQNHKVTIIEREGQTCFSLRPQLLCSSHCKPSKNINKTVDFHCISDNMAAQRWVQMVKKGANPDFSQKGSNYRETVSLPERCVL